MQMTLQHAVDLLDAGELPYSAANAAKVRGSARKCARMRDYNCDLSRIPVDPDAFVARWNRHMRDKDAPEGFETFKQFSTWHSNVKSLMDHVSGKRRDRDLLRGSDDDWSRLLDTMSGLIRRTHKGTGLQQHHLVALTVLRNIARENGKLPGQLTAGMIHQWMKTVSQSQRNAIRRAGSTLNKLQQFSDAFAPGLLPDPIEAIPAVTTRRVTPSLPPRIAEAIKSYEENLRTGEARGGLLNGLRKPGRSEGTVKNAREAAQWFFCCMVELDLLDLDDDPDPSSYATLSCIQAAFDAEIDGGFYWRPLSKRTIRKNLDGVFSFLRRFNPDLQNAQTEFFQGAFFRGWEEMSEANREFCRRLVRSDARKWKFFNLARLFHERAAPMIASFDTLPHHQKAQAVNWALSAATAAILTFLPLRANTVINLSVEGPDAHVHLSRSKRAVEFVIPPKIVKNNQKIITTVHPRGKTDPSAVLDWWLREARPILMSRLQNPIPNLLLGGAGYARLNKAWRFATASVDSFMSLHQVRHAIASILWNEPGTDIKTIAALLADQPETVARKYAFFDTEAQIERGMTGMASVNAALEKGHRQ